MIRADWTALSAFQGRREDFYPTAREIRSLVKVFLLVRSSIARKFGGLGSSVGHQWELLFESVEDRGDACPYITFLFHYT